MSNATPLAPSEFARPDDRLLAEFRDGNPAAYRTVQGWIRDTLRRNPYGAHGDEVEDIVQQSLIALWRTCSRDGFRLQTGLKALTRTVVLARCIDRLRRKKAMVELDDSLLDPCRGPEERAVGTDEWSRVRRAVAELSEPCQELIRLHFLEGLSYREMAQRLDRAEVTLRVRMFQCMKQLRRTLATPAMSEP